MADLSTEARDAGQAAVPPHSLKLVASARRTLSMASSLSTHDRPTAGSTAKGGLAQDRGFFPFSVWFGAMAMERTELRSDWGRKLGFEEAEEFGSVLPAIGNNHVGCRGRLARRISRLRGESETPMSNQSPHVDQGRRLLGLAALRTCPLASPEAKPEHALGPGATVGVLGMGVPRLACLWPTAWLCERARTAHLHQQALKTLARGQPREADGARPLREWPHQVGSRGAERSRQGKPHEVPVT